VENKRPLGNAKFKDKLINTPGKSVQARYRKGGGRKRTPEGCFMSEYFSQI
jgi:hypothetical protein